MKKLLLTVGALALVVGGGAAAASHYDQYQNKKQALRLRLSRPRNAQLKSDLSCRRRLIKANAQLRAECAKGEASYAKLPLAVQKVTAKPVCAPSAPISCDNILWPSAIFEDIVGFPDILNEKLADRLVEQNKQKAK
jgi:hypothetical protein